MAWGGAIGAILRDRANALASAWLVNSLAYSIVYPFIPIYLANQRGLPMETVGLIYPLMGLAIILAPPVSGILADRLGERAMMQFGQGARGVLFVVLAVMALVEAPFWLFAVVLMVNAAVGTAFQVGADAYLAGMSTPEERPKLYGKIRIGTNIGWTIGPMAGAFLSEAPFWLVFALTSVLCFFGVKYTGKYCNAVMHTTAAHREKRVALGEIVFHRQLAPLLASSFLLYLLTSQLYSTFSPFARDVAGVSATQLGFIYSLNGLTIICAQLPAIRLMNHFALQQATRLVLGALLYAGGYLLFGFGAGAGAGLLAVGVVVLTLGEAVINPSLYSEVSRLAPPGTTGRYMASLSLVRGVGYAAGPYVGLIALAKLPGHPLILWGGLAFFALLAAAGYWKLRKKSRPMP